VSYYPVFLDLRDRPCAVLGGCAMAEEKVRGLLAAGARVTVIAPSLTPALAELAAEGRILHRAREYQPGDLQGVVLAISTDRTPEVAGAVWREARDRNVLLNTVDDVPHCNFIAPAVVRRGDLSIAISTGGKAPVLAVRLRQRLERELGEEHARFLALAGAARETLADRQPDFATRRELWYRLVDSDVLDLLRQGDETAALGRFEEILGVRPVEAAGREQRTQNPLSS
jgi:siroheme synthase-like protein